MRETPGDNCAMTIIALDEFADARTTVQIVLALSLTNALPRARYARANTPILRPTGLAECVYG